MKMDKRVVTLVGLIALLSTMWFGGAAPTHQAGPVRATAAPTILGFPAATELEAKTAQAAFNAADKGKPDPAWKGQKFTIAVYSAGQRGAISGPLYFWRPKFEELTGATYDIVEIPFAELREKIYSDFQTGAHKYDVIINCSNWYGDAIGKDWNGDGKPDDGITLHLKVGGQGFFHFMALSAPYVVIPAPGDNPIKVDKYHNVYWFDPDTMDPLINSPGHVAALEMLLKLSK